MIYASTKKTYLLYRDDADDDCWKNTTANHGLTVSVNTVA